VGDGKLVIISMTVSGINDRASEVTTLWRYTNLLIIIIIIIRF